MPADTPVVPNSGAAHLDKLAFRLSRSALDGSGLAPERIETEASRLLTAMRSEIASGLAHGIAEAEIGEGVATMARMHRFIVTGQHGSTRL